MSFVFHSVLYLLPPHTSLLSLRNRNRPTKCPHELLVDFTQAASLDEGMGPGFGTTGLAQNRGLFEGPQNRTFRAILNSVFKTKQWFDSDCPGGEFSLNLHGGRHACSRSMVSVPQRPPPLSYFSLLLPCVLSYSLVCSNFLLAPAVAKQAVVTLSTPKLQRCV
jgi:hypothetical protein